MTSSGFPDVPEVCTAQPNRPCVLSRRLIDGRFRRSALQGLAGQWAASSMAPGRMGGPHPLLCFT